MTEETAHVCAVGNTHRLSCLPEPAQRWILLIRRASGATGRDRATGLWNDFVAIRPESGRVPARRRQHAARQRSSDGRSQALSHPGGRARAAASDTGRFSKRSAQSLAMPTISARCSATGSSTRATPVCSACRPSSSTTRSRTGSFPDRSTRSSTSRQWGPPVIFSDGDVVFQPRKVERSGLFDAVEHRALIYIHKELELDDVERRYPADHYVLVDDKVRILTAVKEVWGARLTTVFPRQGHYAHDPSVATYPHARRHDRADRRPARLRPAGVARGVAIGWPCMTAAAQVQSILTINGGSSSIKFAVYRANESFERRLSGAVDRIGSAAPL